jgi:hypothetical protein
VDGRVEPGQGDYGTADEVRGARMKFLSWIVLALVAVVLILFAV